MELSLRRFQSQKLLSTKRRGRRQEIPPTPARSQGARHSPSLPHSASFLERQRGLLPAAEARKLQRPKLHRSQSTCPKKNPRVTRGKKEKRLLCFVACSFTGKLHLCLHPLCTVSHSIRTSLFMKFKALCKKWERDSARCLSVLEFWGRKVALSLSP